MNRSLSSGPIVWLGIVATTCLLLVLFQSMLWLVLPLLLSIVAHYLMSPLVNVAIARGLTRARAVLIVTIALSLFLIAIGFDIEPKVSALMKDLPAELKSYESTANRLVDNAKRTLGEYVPMLVRKELLVTSKPAAGAQVRPPSTLPTNSGAVTGANDIANEVAEFQEKYSGDIAMQLAHWIPSLLLVPYITYFFLLDGPRFKRFLVQAIPNAFFEKTLDLFFRVEDQMRRYFQGMLALTALDAICLGTGLWFLGLNAPFFLAIVTAVMAWLPYLGSIGGALLVALVAAHDFPASHWLPYEVIGLFIGVRLLDDFVFLPMTVGRSLHMHPLVTVLMILLGGAVAGISGLLLVMPVLGVVMVAGQIIGELLTDERILARWRHAKHLRKRRARADLYPEEQ